MASLMDLLHREAGKVHYPFHDERTETIHQLDSLQKLQAVLASPAGLTVDCSQSVTLICHLSGLKDPNGHGYSQDGYTGTLLANPAMKHYHDPGGANVGALVVFGPGTGEHVAMVRHPGHDPILFSHGQEAGPFFLPLSSERRFHSPPVTFLNITKL